MNYLIIFLSVGMSVPKKFKINRDDREERDEDPCGVIWPYLVSKGLFPKRIVCQSSNLL